MFFPLKTVLAILGPVHFCMYFRSLSISTKEPSGILMEIVLNLEINLEIIAILAILSWQTHDEKSIYLSLHTLNAKEFGLDPVTAQRTLQGSEVTKLDFRNN